MPLILENNMNNENKDFQTSTYIVAATTAQNDFHRLVRDLSDVLGPSSGLDSDDINPLDIQKLMKSYSSCEAHWARYALADSSRPYTRNLVDEGNGKSNLLVLVWSPNAKSPIHDHANAHCVMKILKGSLKESLYQAPCHQAPILTKETTYTTNEVTHISDKIGLHRVSNPSLTDFAVSLHLYTPPHAANHGFHLFNEQTGRKTHASLGQVFSDKGIIVGDERLEKFKVRLC